jgi:hypothetical protein
MVRECWKNDKLIKENLNVVCNKVNEWRLLSFDHVKNIKRELMARLGGIQRAIHNGNGSGGLRRLEKKLHIELDDILKKEELMWFQRSRAKWLTDGDRNTKYYHLKTVQRRRKNNVTMLRNGDGVWVEDVENIHSMVNEFYKDLFSFQNQRHEWITTSPTYPTFEDKMKDMLGVEVDNDEVKRAVFNMNPWKAPGPDGFPAGFYQKSWEIVGESVCGFVRRVWGEPSLIAEVNQIDICLIPKVDHPEFVTQFRPISLCNTIYKIVTKVIVERLKDHIPHIVSPFQTGFVPGRSIHENIVVAQELVHSMNKMSGTKGYFTIKVDISKAYDKLSWEIIWRVLTEVGLPEKMINVIMHAVTSVETNVKRNGARAEYFRPQRGI